MKYILTTIVLLMAVSASADFYTETAPHQPFDKVAGFKLMTEKSTSAALFKTGVRKGDVVISVNGRGIASSEEAMKAFNAKDLNEVIVLRDDQPTKLNGRGK